MADKNEVFAQQISELEAQIEQMKAQMNRDATRLEAAAAIEKWASDFFIELAPEEQRNKEYYYGILDQIYKIGKRSSSQTQKFNDRMNKTEKIQTEEKINKLIREMEEKNAALNALADEYMYDVLRKIVFKQFKARGYDYVIQPDINDINNVKHKSSGQSLFRAVEAAKKADKKAEKVAKKNNEDVEYPENGYNKIIEAVVAEFDKLESTFGKEPIEAFKQKYATVEQQADGVVTSREVVDAVTDKVQSIPFLKTVGGKVLVFGGAAVILIIAAIGTFFGVRAHFHKVAAEDANNRANELGGVVEILEGEKAELDITIDEQNTTIDNQNTTISNQTGEITELTNQNQKLEAENEALKNSYGIKDDVVTLNPEDAKVVEDFKAAKGNIKITTGMRVNNLISCQYNMNSGNVEILLGCKNKKGGDCLGYLTFNVPADVAKSENILDFATIMEYAGKTGVKIYEAESINQDENANENLNQDASSNTSVSFSIKTHNAGSLTTVKGSALVVVRNENGAVVSIETYEAEKNYMGNCNEEEAENAMKQELVDMFTEAESAAE